MKILIVLCCTAAIASAAYPYYYASPYYQQVPVIGHNGAPVETPEVQIAKANHFAAHAAATHGVHSAVPYAYHGVFPGIAPDGTPLDTPEVQYAKAAHFNAYNAAAARNGAGHHQYGGYHLAAGPVETPEVQLAKAAHFAAHANARARIGHHYRRRRGIGYGSYPYLQHIPVIGPNGVPVETPEVQAAKAQHFAAFADASSRRSHYVPSASHVGHSYQPYPSHLSAVVHNGVPVDTPEVQAAKAQHFAAHASANKRHANSGHYNNGGIYNRYY